MTVQSYTPVRSEVPKPQIQGTALPPQVGNFPISKTTECGQEYEAPSTNWDVCQQPSAGRQPYGSRDYHRASEDRAWAVNAS